MKALVTGCAGFIGSSLVDRLLELGYDVTGIDCYTDYYARSIKEKNIAMAKKNPCFNFIERDLREMETFPDVDYIFHEAAQAGVRASWGSNFSVYTSNNIAVTQRLLEWYKGKPLKKFVYASSSSVYGNARLPLHEEATPRPISPYGVAKLAAEHLCYLYYFNYQIPVVSLRYFTVYGPRQRPDMAINKFFRAALNNSEITIYGDGTQTRDFTYIDDIVAANIIAAEYSGSGEVFNIGGGNRISVNDLIVLIQEITGHEIHMRKILNQKGDVNDTLADIRSARSILGWKPETNLNKGLTLYYQWLCANPDVIK
jgi:UDP-glucose 4-epimerase